MTTFTFMLTRAIIDPFVFMSATKYPYFCPKQSSVNCSIGQESLKMYYVTDTPCHCNAHNKMKSDFLVIKTKKNFWAMLNMLIDD